MPDNLVISALGSDRPGIVNRLSTVILDQDCNIADSRMTVLGGEFAIILLVTGEPARIEALEQRLQSEQAGLELTITSKRTGSRAAGGGQQTCDVEAVALDHPGIVQRLTGFFADRDVNIEDLDTDSYPAAHTGTAMFRLQMRIVVPADTDIASLREQFIGFCEDMNIDAHLTPSAEKE